MPIIIALRLATFKAACLPTQHDTSNAHQHQHRLYPQAQARCSLFSSTGQSMTTKNAAPSSSSVVIGGKPAAMIYTQPEVAHSNCIPLYLPVSHW